MKKKLIISLLSLMLASSASADTDGNYSLSKKSKKPKVVKDCFEGLNRATFSLNQGLDKVIFKPIANSFAFSINTLDRYISSNNQLIKTLSFWMGQRKVVVGIAHVWGVSSIQFTTHLIVF